MKSKVKVAGTCMALAVVTTFGFLSWGERSQAVKTPQGRITVGPDGKLVLLRHDTWAAACIIAHGSILTNTTPPITNLPRNQ
jgi:hypothetical protein